MSLSYPFPIQNASISFGAEPFYRMLDSLFSAGIVKSTDLAVSQNSGGANMSVDVATGTAIVDFNSPEGGKRQITNSVISNSGTPGSPGADWAVTFTAAHATLPRIDRVVLTVRDANLDAGSDYDAKFKVVPGTATSGANLTNLTGAAAVPNNSLLLANVLIPATSTSITNANIDSTVRVRASVGGGDATGALPVGSVHDFAGSTAPTGYLLCDGSAVSRTTYSALWGVLGSTYGSGDGSTTFNLPDFRGRVAVGKGTHTDVDALGDSDGSALASRRPKHKHTVNDSGHTHSTIVQNGGATAATFAGGGGSNQAVASTGSATTGVTVGPQTGSEPTDGPAYLVVTKIIKY